MEGKQKHKSCLLTSKKFVYIASIAETIVVENKACGLACPAYTNNDFLQYVCPFKDKK